MENMERLNYFSGKRAFVTGGAGFKAKWLIDTLLELGCSVYAVDKRLVFEEECQSEQLQFQQADILDTHTIQELLTGYKPDFVFHFAAQAIVSEAYRSIVSTYSENLLGTLSVFEAIKRSSINPIILNVTTDKVYRNREWIYPYREIDEMGGVDPYSASKACVEIMTESYSESIFKNQLCIINARAGNVIGGGDWNVNRLIPDVYRSIQNRETLIVRNPEAVRPWQHVIEPIIAYLLLVEHFASRKLLGLQKFNIGPGASGEKTVERLLLELKRYSNFDYHIVPSSKFGHESSILKLSTVKISETIGWRPSYNFEESIKLTAQFYESYINGTPENLLRSEQVKEIVYGLRYG